MPPKITPKIQPLSLVSHWQGALWIKARRKGNNKEKAKATNEGRKLGRGKKSRKTKRQ